MAIYAFLKSNIFKTIALIIQDDSTIRDFDLFVFFNT